MSKMSLTEATMLALQGKLLKEEKLEEDIDVSVTDDGTTVVDTDEATVIVTEPENKEVVEEPVETVEVPVEGEETIVPDAEITDEPTMEEIVDGETTEDEEVVESKEVPGTEEEKKLTEGVEDEEEEEEVEEPVEDKEAEEEIDEPAEEIEVSEEIVEEPVEEVEFTIADVMNKLNELQVQLDALTACKEETEETEIVPETEVAEEVEEPIEECDMSTFTEVLNKYFTKEYKVVESVKVENVTKTEEGLLIEAKLLNADKIEKDIKLEMAKFKEGKSFTKYTLKESKGLVTESKEESPKLTMMTFTNKENKLECKYVIKK